MPQNNQVDTQEVNTSLLENTPKVNIRETPVTIEDQQKTDNPVPQPLQQVHVVESPIAAEHSELDTPEKESVPFTPNDEEAKKVQENETKPLDSDVIIDEMVNEINEGTRQPRNFDKMNLCVPCTNDYEKLEKFKEREGNEHRDHLEEFMLDMTSSIQSISEAQRELFSFANALYSEGLTRLGDKTDKLKHSFKGIGDSNAGIPKKFKGQKVVKLSGTEGLVTMTALTGGMRRITLWNSGFTITLRSIPLDILNMFHREANHNDYEYGKQYGAFYYLFSDLTITEFIISTLLPIVICGSSYAHWKDTEKLMSAISIQDFPVIIWAMACMMHPNGTNINFVCAEDDCGHIETKFVDLSKLRLMNTDLINDQMIEHFKQPGWITDEMLDKFRKDCRLDKTIEFDYGEGFNKRYWKIHMKQASLQDYVEAGRDYNTELLKRCSPDDQQEVTSYMTYNYIRQFKAWIRSIEITSGEGDDAQTFIIENDDTVENNRTIYALLEEIQQYYREFANLAREYILDTKISHIAYYFPECPNCKKVPSYGYKGYLPYDPMQNFFTLAVMKLLRAALNREDTSTSQK